jgi:predicted nucleic acid-binding protein
VSPPIPALIAATATVHGVPVYTRDRGFLRLPGVKVELVT